MSRPFEGIRVLDLTHILAGPFCSYQLGLMGADVIKVEPPGGDIRRWMGGPHQEMCDRRMGLNFMTQGGNKRSAVIDLKTEGGRDAYRRLAATADVIVENYRTGTLEDLGVGYRQLSAEKPDLVYCACTGYGGTGPKAQHPAYDMVIQAASGLMMLTGKKEQLPVKVGPPVIDYATGTMAAFAVSSALFRRERTGEGAFIDLSMLDTAFLMMSTVIADFLTTGTGGETRGGVSNSGSVLSGSYKTKDRLLMIACNSPREFRSLCEAIGKADLPGDPRFASHDARREHGAALKAILEEIFASRTATEWEAILNEHRVPASMVRTFPEAIAQPQVATRNVHRTLHDVPGLDRDLTLPVSAFMIGEDGPRLDTPPPRLGEHTEEVLREAGLGDGEIAALLRDGAVAGLDAEPPATARA
ncbi:MAG: CoA transferase [Acetobacterales bacterium]